MLKSVLAYTLGRHLPILILPCCCLFAAKFSLQVLSSGEMLFEQQKGYSRALRSNHTLLLDYPLVFHSPFPKCLSSKRRPAASTGQLPRTDRASHGVLGLQSLTLAIGQLVSSHSFCQQNKNDSTLATGFHMDTGINQTQVCLPLNRRVRRRWGEEFAVVSLRDCIPNSDRDNGVPAPRIADYYNHQQTPIHIQGKCSNSHICIHFTLT